VNTDWKEFTSDIDNINIDFEINLFSNISQQLYHYNLLVMNIVEKHAPLKRRLVKNRPTPWFNKHVQDLIKTRNKARVNFNKSKMPADWNHYKKLRNSVNIEIRKLKKRLFSCTIYGIQS